MGYDTQIQGEGKGSIKLEHGVFKDLLCVPSMETNLLSVYSMEKHSLMVVLQMIRIIPDILGDSKRAKP